MRPQVYAQVIALSMIALGGCGASDTKSDQEQSPSAARARSQTAAPVITAVGTPIKIGEWGGQDASGRAHVRFRIKEPNKATNLQMLVPVFESSPGQSTCRANLSDAPVKPPLNIELTDTSARTAITLNVKRILEPSEMIMDVAGSCQGSLILLGLEIRAKWLRA
ncbi:hypothetical protein [Actinomadura decatromicini]|uniref:Lipoprotein n=1 Tax=Actinomadura decatromicini TaxID=2604572 RepID=A0A5D3FF16_9ACTN|nr:hypothetical protein [Actinomadura decatromicini]TYK46689.1 hypothetical protein FXF68_22810 [Actinomadura decatromicini]